MAPKSVPVPMITRVRLKNFRSIAECDVTLGPLTVLVGPNGSGKSNFLHALDFLSDALNNGLETAVRRRGGMNSLLSRWALDDPDAALSIELELDLSEDRRGVYDLALKPCSTGGYVLTRERCTIISGRDGPQLAEFVSEPPGSGWFDRRGGSFAQPRLAKPLRNALRLPHTSDHLHFGAVYRTLMGIECYRIHVDEMRKPRQPDGGERLKSDGANVASVLERMTDESESGFGPADRITDWLRVITAGVEAVHSVNVSGYQVVKFEQAPSEGGTPWTFDASEMSDGTLRTLGVLVALYQGRMREISPVTLAAIEEPETAVHPGAATAILGAMTEASLITQVLATTHSPAMLDDDDLDIGILRGVSRVNGRTTIGPIGAGNRQILEEQLYTAGELLRMGHLLPDEPPDGPVARPVAAPV